MLRKNSKILVLVKAKPAKNILLAKAKPSKSENTPPLVLVHSKFVCWRGFATRVNDLFHTQIDMLT